MKLIDFFPERRQLSIEDGNNGHNLEVVGTEDKPLVDYRLISYVELLADPPKPLEWLVERLFPEGGIGIIGGDGGVGKSWLGLLLGVSVSSGSKFLGEFGVKQGKVLIIDEENALTLTYQRLQKLSKGLKLEAADLPLSFLNNEAIRLDSDDSYNALKSILQKEKPSLIIVDSLVRVHGADENSAKEMERVFRRAKELTTLYNSTIIFLHHTRKLSQNYNYASQMLRGSSDIRNFVDSYVYMWADGNEKTLVHDKSRYAIPEPRFKVLMQDIDDGTAITMKYTGEVKPLKESKVEIAKDSIVEQLKNRSEVSRQDIIKALKGTVGETKIDQALKELELKGIIDSDGGEGTRKIYRRVQLVTVVLS